MSLVQKGTGNIEGPFWCQECGKTTCTGECVEPATPLVTKANVARFTQRRVDLSSSDGAMATPDELEGFLAGYLGDSVFAKRFADCMTMIKAKNADYSQGEQKGDRIAAFRRIARDIDVPMTKVWAIFCQKHWGAIMRFVKEGHVESEPIDGRINDVINYMVLLGAIIGDQK